MTRTRSLLVLLGLCVAWLLMMALRNAWTPDEPRELALAMSQVDRFTVLPSLAGVPFTEKPPLAYWVSGLTMRYLGVSAGAARVPLFAYAILSTLAVYLVGRRLGSKTTGLVAALVFATSWQVFGVQVWLATDALLLAGVTLALLGIHMAVGPPFDERRRWPAFVCLHVGLLLALFSKNLAGWLVPISALVTFLFFERRLREVLHPAFWLPALGSLGVMMWWARSVGSGADGAASLHALFWDNLVGRLVSYGASSDAVRALGHKNWPGKYLVELPIYLLPWTPLAVGALLRLWRDRSARLATQTSWRFALCATLPGLIVLSLAATARGIYAATILPGAALFIAVLITCPVEGAESRNFVARMFRWNAWVVLVLDAGALVAVFALFLLRGARDVTSLCVAAFAAVLVAWSCIRSLRESRADTSGEAITGGALWRLAGAHVVTLIALAVTLVPLLNQWQDLYRIAGFLERESQGRPMILWRPDETTLAMSDLYMRKPACVVPFDDVKQSVRAQRLDDCLRAFPNAALVALELCGDRDCSAARRLLSGADPLQTRKLLLGDETLLSAGIRPDAAIVRPGGRAYVVALQPP